jgi:hypothetical protein
MLARTALMEWELRQVDEELAVMVRRLHVGIEKLRQEALSAFEELPVVIEGESK